MVIDIVPKVNGYLENVLQFSSISPIINVR